MEPNAVRPQAHLPRLASPVRLALLILWMVALLSATSSAVAPSADAAGAAGSPHVLAQTAVLVDGATGAVIWQRDAHRPVQVASTTKILTALVAEDAFAANQLFTVPKCSGT
jgi:D-alanyl-D-alanine carboxypeptidase